MKKKKHNCTRRCLNAIHLIVSPQNEYLFVQIYHGKITHYWWMGDKREDPKAKDMRK